MLTQLPLSTHLESKCGQGQAVSICHLMFDMAPNRPLGAGDIKEIEVLSSQYGYNLYSSYKTWTSFKISRPLQGREQLDFSHESGTDWRGIFWTDWCGVFLHSYWPRDSPGMDIEEIEGADTDVNSGMR